MHLKTFEVVTEPRKIEEVINLTDSSDDDNILAGLQIRLVLQGYEEDSITDDEQAPGCSAAFNVILWPLYSIYDQVMRAINTLKEKYD